MRKIFILLLAALIVSCADEAEQASTCGTPAIVRDLTGLDGCRWVFELQDGRRLEPVRVFFCGTPPLPEDTPQDVLQNFELVDGKHVLINYELSSSPSICMVGETAIITCISEIPPGQD